MIKGKIYEDCEWSDTVSIISITPVPNIELKLGNVLTQKIEYHVLYLNRWNNLTLFKASSLTHIGFLLIIINIKNVGELKNNLNKRLIDDKKIGLWE